MDGQFESMRNLLSNIGIHLNTFAAGEYAADIERYIRFLKGRIKAALNITPFASFPKLMLIKCAIAYNFRINSVSPKDGVSKTISPRTMATGLTLNYGKHLSLPFGAYAQVYDESNNTMRACTVGAIDLHPMGNVNGG